MIADEFSRMSQCDSGHEGIKVGGVCVDVEAITCLQGANYLLTGIVIITQLIAVSMENEVTIMCDSLSQRLGAEEHPRRLERFTVHIFVGSLNMVRCEVKSAVLKIWHRGV